MTGLERVIDISTRDNAFNLMKTRGMQDKTLGECFSHISWMGTNGANFALDSSELVFFVQSWMQQNIGKYSDMFYSTGPQDFDIRLPFIERASCPRKEEHANYRQENADMPDSDNAEKIAEYFRNNRIPEGQTVRDRMGRVRCAHRGIRMFKPDYIDSYTIDNQFTDTPRTTFMTDSPHDPADHWFADSGEVLPKYAKVYEEWIAKIEHFEKQDATVPVIDVCYAILSDTDVVLSLETVFDRLNRHQTTKQIFCNSGLECDRLDELDKNQLEYYVMMGKFCIGHEAPTQQTSFLMEKSFLAQYVAKWYQQNPGELIFLESER